ncbi:TIR protein [Streptomyces yokosukanensis]|uniref:TIR protein n=1 Tax=Streptomyces yokosukanensis TaxID=67386 RepID=A0A117Q1D1_9ACTN|nr:toll/interleukin-1 receptor domain-containing protein [Streptomyces yokosukanensis]KUN03913.1 TIR protein [Streptomyces yokosukanensis]
MWDVFLSYSRGDVERVRPLVRALRDGGLTVFTDETGVASFAGISDTIRRELGRSKALLAYYSAAYPEREACQWELTTAYLAGLGEGDPRRRVMVVNPEAFTGHIHPVELRDARHASADDPAALVAVVREHVARLAGPMTLPERGGGRGRYRAPEPHPEFLGRLSELWRVHSALHAHAAPLTVGRSAARAVQIRGMAGIGKTLLAEEYAVRFEAAYPGGVFRLDGRDFDASLRASGLSGGAQSVFRQFDAVGEPFLWIVDGVDVERTPLRAIAATAAPHPLGHTVFTLRSRAYDTLGTPVDLGPLDDAQARQLVGGDRALADAVGGHPLALTLLGRALQAGHRTQDLYDRLHARGGSLLDALAGDDVTAAVVHDVDTADAADALRCAAALHPLPVTADDVRRVLAAVDRVPKVVASLRAGNGIAELRTRSLLTPAVETAQGPADGDRWSLHPVTLHAWHQHDPAPARTEALRHAALRTLCGHRETVTLALPGSRREALVSAAPSESERMAAFDIQVELVTRIGVQELAPGTGSLREALSSLKSLIDFTRATLHTYSIRLEQGTADGAATVQSLAYALINGTIRPFTTTWHPRLAAYEARRPADAAPLDHELGWPEASQMRADLAALREPLRRIAEGLAEISGADFGMPAAG